MSRIKRVIIDIDNTLIEWKQEYRKAISQALEEFGCLEKEDLVLAIQKAFDDYEIENYTFDKKKMTNFINKALQREFPETFITRIIELWSECAPEQVEDEIKETLTQLSQNYELVILTDWFAKEQKTRLEKAGISQFFSVIYSAEKTKRKPFPEAFAQAIGNHKPEECAMIGDDFERDILGAMKAGILPIWLTKKERKEQNNQRFIQVANWKEIKEVLSRQKGKSYDK